MTEMMDRTKEPTKWKLKAYLVAKLGSEKHDFESERKGEKISEYFLLIQLYFAFYTSKFGKM